MAIKELWAQYVDWLTSQNPTEAAKLQGPASVEDFNKFNDATGYEFPSQLRALYEINNGAWGRHPGGGDGNFNFAIGHEFMVMDDIISAWKLSTRGYDLDLVDAIECYPVNTIKRAVWNLKWVPFLYDSAGNFIGIDLDPDNAGTQGQVITFGRDEYNVFVVADSLNAFLELILNQITLDNVEVITEEDGVKHWNLRNSEHFTDGLKAMLVPPAQRSNPLAAKSQPKKLRLGSALRTFMHKALDDR